MKITPTPIGVPWIARDPADIRSMLTRIAAGSAKGIPPAWDVMWEFERPRLVASYASRIRDLFGAR